MAVLSILFAMRYKLIIAYDGTNFSGWQTQENSSAIQPFIQAALQTALRHTLNLTGSGRTDAGVHARGQVAHFDSDVSFEPTKLLLSLNALLPKEIRILKKTDLVLVASGIYTGVDNVTMEKFVASLLVHAKLIGGNTIKKQCQSVTYVTN